MKKTGEKDSYQKIRIWPIFRLSTETYRNHFMFWNISNLLYSLGFCVLAFLLNLYHNAFSTLIFRGISFFACTLFFQIFYLNTIRTTLYQIDYPDKAKAFLFPGLPSILSTIPLTMLFIFYGSIPFLTTLSVIFLWFSLSLIPCYPAIFPTPFLMIDRQYRFFSAMDKSKQLASQHFGVLLKFHVPFFLLLLFIIIVLFTFGIISQAAFKTDAPFFQLIFFSTIFTVISTCSFCTILQTYLYRLLSSIYFNDMITPDEIEGMGRK